MMADDTERGRELEKLGTTRQKEILLELAKQVIALSSYEPTVENPVTAVYKVP
jgi:hypothetical protein